MIVLVDDNADYRLVLKLALEAEGFSVRDAASARDAVALQRERPASVLITDIFMPDGDGFELIGAVRAEFPDTKVIVVSGGASRMKSDYLHSAKLVGADAVFGKPLDVTELVETLRSFARGGPAK